MSGQVEPAPVWEKYTDLAVGEILRRTRTHYGLTLDDVAAALHIRAIQLGALETGETERLPGRVYAIGFVRAYAEYLGLDGDKMVHLFKVQSVGGRTRPELAMPVPASESKAPNKFILAGSLAALVLLLLALAVVGAHHKPAAEIIPSPPAILPASGETIALPPFAGALDSAVDAVGDSVAAIAATPLMPTRITIHAIDTAWIEIRDDHNKALFSNILKAGDSYSVPDKPQLKLDTGNLGALQILVDGRAMPPLGKTGDVRRGIALDPDLLQKGTALPPAAADPSKPLRKRAARTPDYPVSLPPDIHRGDHFTGVP